MDGERREKKQGGVIISDVEANSTRLISKLLMVNTGAECTGLIVNVGLCGDDQKSQSSRGLFASDRERWG